MSDLKDLKNKDKVVTKHFDTLCKFAEFRNLDAHSNHLALHFAEPHGDIVTLIEKIANEINPEAKALEFAIKSDRIYAARIVDNARDVIRYMIAKKYTHVPILDNNGKMIGIFSENAIFNYFESHDEIILDASVNISEFRKFISIDMRLNEVFSFVSRHETMKTVKDMFVKERQQRLGAIFITENGSAAEKLLGLLTPWDVLPH